MARSSTSSGEASPLARGPSPDHGFVLLSDGDHSDAPPKEDDAAAAAAGEDSAPPSRNPSPAPGSTLPSWLLRGAEGLHSGPSGEPSGASAAPGSAARLAQENAQLRGQLLELAHQHEWALDSVVATKDREIADLSSKLRRISNSFDRQSLDVAAFHRDLMHGCPEEAAAHPEIVPMSFDRLPGMLASKKQEAGGSPTTKVALDASGLPKYVCLDWDTPQEDAEQPPVNEAAQPKGARIPRVPGSHAVGAGLGHGARRVAHGAEVAGHSIAAAGRAVGRLPGSIASSRAGTAVRRTVAQATGPVGSRLSSVPHAVGRAGHAVGSTATGFLGGVTAAAGSAASCTNAWLSDPAVASHLELALGLSLITLTGVTAVRSIRAGKLAAGRQSRGARHAVPRWAKKEAEAEDEEPGSHIRDAAEEAESGAAEPAGDQPAESAQGSLPLFPLDLSLPSIELPRIELPTIEFLDSGDEGDDVRVLHLPGLPEQLPSFLRLG